MQTVQQEFRALWSALLYFTRLPLPCPARYDAQDLRRAAGWWPLTGMLVGGLVAVLCLLLGRVLPQGIACALGLLGGILLSGAMHEDGLADVCDGLGGGSTRERALEIMKDSSVGAFGAIALIVSLGLRWQSLCALPLELLPVALLSAHALSRAAAVSLMAGLDYARPEGPSKARALAHRMGGGRLALAWGLGCLPLVCLPTGMLWVALLPPLAAGCAGLWFWKRLGGYTGDCLGAAQQFGELAMLLGILAACGS